MGHIGTTLDPEYIGPSLIAVHNHGEQDLEMVPEQDTFVSLIFYYVRTRSSVPDTNRPGRPEILKQIQVGNDDDKWLDEPYRKEKDKLRSKLKNSEEFKEFKRGSTANIFYFLPYIILTITIFLCLLLYIYFDSQQSFLEQNNWYNTLILILDRALFLCFGALILQFTTDIRRG